MKIKKHELTQETITILTEYYNNNLEPLFDKLADDVLWIGPRKGQLLRGKEAMTRAWSDSPAVQRFSLGDISVVNTSTGTNNLEVMLEYDVLTIFPDEAPIRHHQRCQFSWGYRRVVEDGVAQGVPRICMIHLSNTASESMREGQIYAESAAQEKLDSVTGAFSGDSFSLIMPVKLENGVTLYLHSDSVIWIESTNAGRHSIIHAASGTYCSTERVRALEKKFKGYLVRAHASYLISPIYVLMVKRFEVTMTDGTVLPVPQKKYTAFKHDLDRWFTSQREMKKKLAAEPDRRH